MQELINQTPYAIAVVPFIRKDGRGMAATIVKGTFDLYEGSETPTLADEQVPIVYADDYFHEGEKPSSIRYAGEAVPLKPGTDVAVVGYAYPPVGWPKAWTFSCGSALCSKPSVYLATVSGTAHWATGKSAPRGRLIACRFATNALSAARGH